MTKDKWIEHMEASGVVRPSLGGDRNAWLGQQVAHRGMGCKECASRAKTNKARLNSQFRDGVMRDMGLVKVKGAVSGRTYWE